MPEQQISGKTQRSLKDHWANVRGFLLTRDLIGINGEQWIDLTLSMNALTKVIDNIQEIEDGDPSQRNSNKPNHDAVEPNAR